MAHWLAEHLLTTDDLRTEEKIPMTNKEFYMSLSMVGIALALFGIIVRVLGV